MFYPSGTEILEQRLIEDPYRWLDKFPEEKLDFKKAVQSYLSKQYDEVIRNCFLTIEGLIRKILNNTKTLDNNQEELLRRLNLSNQWKGILANHIKYAHESRHASSKRHSLNPLEVEAFLYQTGLLVR